MKSGNIPASEIFLKAKHVISSCKNLLQMQVAREYMLLAYRSIDDEDEKERLHFLWEKKYRQLYN